MRMLKIAAMMFAALVLIVLVYAATRPATFIVERKIVIQAPAVNILPLINHLQSHRLWSPFEQLDPAMQRTFTGPPQGVGAIYTWQGNGQAGQGRMEILQSDAQHVLIKLDFIKPLQTNNLTEFTLTPTTNGTEVSWTMSGPMPYISKLISVFVSMETMVGSQFEQGLANLKQYVESSRS